MVLGFDIGGTRLKAGAVDGGVLAQTRIVAASFRDAAASLEQLVALGRKVTRDTQVEGIGVSVRGVVDPEERIVIAVNPPLTCLIGEPFALRLEEEFGAPVLVDNDARLYALGELRYGAGRGVENMVCLTLGTGVGVGVVVNGHVLRGRRGVLGILGGHFTVAIDGPACTCGNVGCLEALLRNCVTTSEPSRFTRVLGAGIVTLIHAYDPDLVLLGGGSAAEESLPALRDYIHQHAWTRPPGRVRLELAEHRDFAAVLGAAEFARVRSTNWAWP